MAGGFRTTALARRGPALSVTVSGGEIDYNPFVSAIPEGGAGSGADTIDTINGGNEGDTILIVANDGPTDPITIAASGGNTSLKAQAVINEATDSMTLIKHGSVWIAASRDVA